MYKQKVKLTSYKEFHDKLPEIFKEHEKKLSLKHFNLSLISTLNDLKDKMNFKFYQI